MEINKNGAVIKGMYLRAAPGDTWTSFEDADGATVTIDTATVLALSELIKFDAEHRGYSVNMEAVEKPVEDISCGSCTHMDEKDICRNKKSSVFGEYVNSDSCPCEGENYNKRG